MARRKKKNLHIAVIGGIAAGKTTATQVLAEGLKAEPILELFEENPFLPLFTQNKSRWSFATQLFFVRDRLRQASKIKKLLKKSTVIVDAGMLMNTEVYTKNQLIQGYMTATEWQFYLDLVNDLKKDYVEPDLVVYLKCAPETLLKRIRARRREFERHYDVTYLAQLVDRLEELVGKLTGEGKSLVVFDAEKNNFTKSAGKTALIKEVKKALRSLRK